MGAKVASTKATRMVCESIFVKVWCGEAGELGERL